MIYGFSFVVTSPAVKKNSRENIFIDRIRSEFAPNSIHFRYGRFRLN